MFTRIALIILQLTAKFTIKIIQAYAPISDHDDEEVDMFEDLIRTTKQRKLYNYTGDFNTKIGLD